MNVATDYDARSLLHERRMLDLYRKGAASDGGLVQPLANACCRAAAFEWRLHEDAGAVRSLWEEAARTLADGFLRKRSGFEQSAEKLILALHFSLAGHAPDVAQRLVHAKVSVASNARSSRQAVLLLEAYQSVVRALFEGERKYARVAQHSLQEARSNSDRERQSMCWAVDWQVVEHYAICEMLKVIAGALEGMPARADGGAHTFAADSRMTEFCSLLDAALLQLDHFCETAVNHRPKLYCWLPGISACVLAREAGLSLNWLDIRHEINQQGYSRLPAQLVQRVEPFSARAFSL